MLNDEWIIHMEENKEQEIQREVLQHSAAGDVEYCLFLHKWELSDELIPRKWELSDELVLHKYEVNAELSDELILHKVG